MGKTLKYLFLFVSVLWIMMSARPYLLHSASSYSPSMKRYLLETDSLLRSDTLGEVDKKFEKIYVEADVSYYKRSLLPEAQILTGHVKFRHKDAIMMCDSALLFEKENRLVAFDNVNIYQGDSVHIACEWLEYDGINLLSRLRRNVILEQGQTTLYTDSLDYSRASGIGYYFDSGTIVDSLNELSSLYGEYSTITKKAFFEDSVKLVNPNFVMNTDRLDYNTETKVANITSPTTIVSDSSSILSSNGVYDTDKDIAHLYDRSEVLSGSKKMTADTIIYQKKDSLALLYGHIDLRDTLEKKSLHGDYAEYHENTGYGMAEKRAYVVDYSGKDTLWMHAKKLFLMKDSAQKDVVKGIYNVRVFRKDIQAVSDSMTYSEADSVLHLDGYPVLWNNKSQVVGDSVRVFMKNGNPDYAKVIDNAYVSMEIKKDKYYNQIKGNEIYAYFKNDNMDSVRVNGNAETIYYSEEQKDSTVSVQYKIQSVSIKMNFENQNVKDVKFYENMKGVGTPVFLLKDEDLFYPSFKWYEDARPKSFKDIFLITPQRGSSSESNGKETSAPPRKLGVLTEALPTLRSDSLDMVKTENGSATMNAAEELNLKRN